MIKKIMAATLLLPIIVSAGQLERCMTPDGKVFYGSPGGRLGEIHCEKTVKKKETTEIVTRKNIEIIDLHAEALKKLEEEESLRKKESKTSEKKNEDKKDVKTNTSKTQESSGQAQIFKPPENDKNQK